MAFDGEFIYGGDFDTTIVLRKLNLNGDSVATIIFPNIPEGDNFNLPKALACKPGTDLIYTAEGPSKIYAIDIDRSVIVDQFYVNIPGDRPNIWGLAWNPVDDDGMPLYAMDWVHNEDDRRMRIVKINPETRKYMIVGDISRHIRDNGKGLTIGFDWQRGITSLAAISDAGGQLDDSLRIYEAGPDSRFLSIDNPTGIVPPDGSMNLNLSFSANDYEFEDTLRMGLLIEHNARGDAGLIPITFIIDNETSVEDNDELPLEFGLEQAYPNPFNSLTRIGYSLEKTSFTRLSVYDITGRLVDVLVEDEIPNGRHFVTFDAGKLASGIYFYRLETGERKEVKRMVLLR